MPSTVIPLLCLGLLLHYGLGFVHFQGDTVLRLHTSTHHQLDFLQTLYSDEHFDFWTRFSLRRPIDVRVQQEKVDEFQKSLNEKGIPFEVLIENLQDMIETQRKSHKRRPVSLDASYFEQYHSFESNIDWLNQLSQSFSNMSKVLNLGETFEGRPLLAIKIFSPTESSKKKKSIWIDGGIHAREWISPATVNYLIWAILTDYEKDTDLQKILKKVDLFILPMLNPDGFSYSWEHNRLWRKNRVVNPGAPNNERCRGTDLNRNWGYEWGGPGSNTNPCSEVYQGPSAFSENETRIVSEFLTSIQSSLIGYMNFHSYGQLWLYPWGYQLPPTPDEDIMQESAKKSVKVLKKVFGTVYEVMQSADLYPAYGGVEDWIYGVLHVKFATVVELRDTGKHGFLLPEDQIIPSGMETYEAVKKFFEHTISNS